MISISAVGSLRENLKPLDMVLPDQFIVLTKRRESTFLGSGAVAHVSMAQPAFENLSNVIARALVDADPDITLHRGAPIFVLGGAVPKYFTKIARNTVSNFTFIFLVAAPMLSAALKKQPRVSRTTYINTSSRLLAQAGHMVVVGICLVVGGIESLFSLCLCGLYIYDILLKF